MYSLDGGTSTSQYCLSASAQGVLSFWYPMDQHEASVQSQWYNVFTEPSSDSSHSMPLLLKVKTSDGVDGSTVNKPLGLSRMLTMRSAVAGPASVTVFLEESDGLC